MSPAELSLAPGSIVAGRFRVEAPIGSGGHGHVVRATGLDTGRSVALKILRPELVDSAEERGRFRREARVAQQLEHPNIVRLYEVGETADGLCFMAFELLSGEPLSALLAREAPLSAARTARIATQVLKSLMAAHERGVIHRDVKPPNVFLCRYAGEQDFVKVLDFGVAKPLVSSGATEAGLTSEGELIGTPSYMAPEQVAGLAVTPSTDLYALGLVMAECLSGRVVYPATDLRQVVLSQLSPHPVPLDPLVLGSALGPVIRRAAEKLPPARYQSAAEMLAALEVAVGTASPVSISVEPAASAAGSARPEVVATADTMLARDVLAPLAAPASGAGSPRGSSPSATVPQAAGSWPGSVGTVPSASGLPAAASWPGSYAGAPPAQASGSWPTAAPTLLSPPRPRAPASRFGTRAIIAIALGVVVPVFVATTVWLAPRRGGPGPPEGSSPAPAGDAPVSQATCNHLFEAVSSRVEAAGWTPVYKSAMVSSGICLVTMQLNRGGKMPVVYVARGGGSVYQTLQTRTYVQIGCAVARQEETGTLWAVYLPKDKPLANELLTIVMDSR
jgi:eukaryotic-like serine/threonine-protein kinase